MNLNKWMCRHFDTDEHGYVTVGSVFVKILSAFFYIMIVLMIFTVGGIFLVILQNGISQGEPVDSWSEFLIVMIKAWLIPITVVLITFLASFILYKISLIKIAKCPLKEDDNK